MEQLPPDLSARIDAFLADPSTGVRRTRQPTKLRPFEEEFETIRIQTTDGFGWCIGEQAIRVHHRSKCAGQACCIHSPSDHHMARWPQLWRDDRKFMERTCPHGIGHPDPDHIFRDGDFGGHGCDGCCQKGQVE